MKKFSDFYAPRAEFKQDTDPVTPYKGQVWYNKSTGKFMQNINEGATSASVDMTSGDEPSYGYIFSAMAQSVIQYSKYLDPNLTTSDGWNKSFSLSNIYPNTGELYRLSSQVTNASRDTGTFSGSFDFFDIDWILNIFTTRACWSSDINEFDVEFRDANNVSIFAFRTLRSGSYGHNFYHGASIATANIYAGVVGGNYYTSGNFNFTPTSATFTNTQSANYNKSFTFNCDMASVTKIVLVKARTYVSYTGGNGCSAQARLRLDSNPKANDNIPPYSTDYLPMSGTVGGVLVNDGTSASRNGVIANATEVVGYMGNCTRFDATTVCTIPVSILRNSNYTLSFFYRKFVVTADYEYLVAVGAVGETVATNTNGYRINSSMELEVITETGLGIDHILNTGVVLKADGEFHHIAISVSLGSVKVYHDMEPTEELAFINSDTTATTSAIGSDPASNLLNYVGDLERIRRLGACTQLQIEHLFSEPVLPVYYQVNQISPTDAYTAHPNTLFPVDSNQTSVAELIYT